LSFFRKLRD
jgi:hypothetical protein